jgi:ERCC4-related helicase
LLIGPDFFCQNQAALYLAARTGQADTCLGYNGVPEYYSGRVKYGRADSILQLQSRHVVDGQEVNDFALKHGITLVQGDLIGAKWVANQIAVERAVEKAGSNHVITFHSRISTAKDYSTDGARGIKQYLPEFSVFHVNGSQHSSERKQVIRDFRKAKHSLITNARCLTEGIDVPAVDMVAFIDPRHSKIVSNEEAETKYLRKNCDD